jgi:metal-responsive CopG/Arc/MetJ family transcriptional regulator
MKKTIAVSMDIEVLDHMKAIGIRNRSKWIEDAAKELLGMDKGMSINSRFKDVEERLRALEVRKDKGYTNWGVPTEVCGE